MRESHEMKFKLTPDLTLVVLENEDNEELEIFLQSKTGEINLKSLVDFDLIFLSSRRFGVNVIAKPKIVEVDLTKLLFVKEEVLSILHEIAHLKIINESWSPNFEKPYVWNLLLNKLLGEFWSKGSKRMIVEERNAWAGAFYLARDLKKKGFDVLSIFEGVEATREWLRRTGLDYYTTRHIKKFGDRGLRILK